MVRSPCMHSLFLPPVPPVRGISNPLYRVTEGKVELSVLNQAITGGTGSKYLMLTIAHYEIEGIL